MHFSGRPFSLFLEGVGPRRLGRVESLRRWNVLTAGGFGFDAQAREPRAVQRRGAALGDLISNASRDALTLRTARGDTGPPGRDVVPNVLLFSPRSILLFFLPTPRTLSARLAGTLALQSIVYGLFPLCAFV